MSRTFRWGIIGLGKIAHKFAQDLRLVKNARLHAVASRTTEKARHFAAQYEVPHHFGSYEDLARFEELDAVYIATPHIGHCANTLMMLDNKIAVLCEKPFAMNGAEVRQMVDLARRQRVFLMEAMWTRFMPTIQQALSWIKEGQIGAIKSVRADFGFKANFQPDGRLFNQQLGGGSLLDIGIYPVFLSLLLLGKPEQIEATSVIGSSQVDESCGILLRYKGGQMALLHSSIVAKTATEAFIHGDKGSIHIHSRWHEPTSISLHKEGSDPKDVFFSYKGHGYYLEIEEVQKCLAAGQLESKLLPLNFSLDLIDLLDAIRLKAGIFYPRYDQFAKSAWLEDRDRFSMN
ncbi:MAG: Gfo/Idh/MocA family oxidoreductase [Bacteroidota bacterium]